VNSPRFLHRGASYPLLTWTSTMDCWSWSLPAGKDGSCPMESRAPGSICNSCYAQQNRYRFSNVRNAQAARLSFLKESPYACEWALTTFLQEERPIYFRVHDSGDFHTIDAIRMWTRICTAAPDTNFWFPTRGWIFPHWLPALQKLNELPHVSVRPSAIHFGDAPPFGLGLSAGTMSAAEHPFSVMSCPKSVKHTTCLTESCRRCWSKDTAVNYLPHGRLLPDRPVPLTIGATS